MACHGSHSAVAGVGGDGMGRKRQRDKENMLAQGSSSTGAEVRGLGFLEVTLYW